MKTQAVKKKMVTALNLWKFFKIALLPGLRYIICARMALWISHLIIFLVHIWMKKTDSRERFVHSTNYVNMELILPRQNII